jgi:hypothetical protein
MLGNGWVLDDWQLVYCGSLVPGYVHGRYCGADWLSTGCGGPDVTGTVAGLLLMLSVEVVGTVFSGTDGSIAAAVAG